MVVTIRSGSYHSLKTERSLTIDIRRGSQPLYSSVQLSSGRQSCYGYLFRPLISNSRNLVGRQVARKLVILSDTPDEAVGRRILVLQVRASGLCTFWLHRFDKHRLPGGRKRLMSDTVTDSCHPPLIPQRCHLPPPTIAFFVHIPTWPLWRGSRLKGELSAASRFFLLTHSCPSVGKPGATERSAQLEKTRPPVRE